MVARMNGRGCGGRQLKLRGSGARLLRARDTNARVVVRTATFYLGHTWDVSNCPPSIVCSSRTGIIKEEYAACVVCVAATITKRRRAPCVVHCATMR